MKIAICLTAFKRPEYLSQVLSSLQKNDTSDMTMFVGVEPVSPEVIKICKSIDFIKTNITINPRILGVKDNPFQTMSRAFDAGFDMIWQMEDDVLVSPDAADLVRAYSEYNRRDEHLCLNLYNPSSWNDPETVYASKGFNALSLAISKQQWKDHFVTNYHADKRGWDWSMIGLLQRTHLTNLTPALSRSHHIGRDGGTHYRPEHHDHMYVGNKWNQSDARIDFRFKA
jgi:hypothetical protein